MASGDEYRRHKAHLEGEVKRLLYQNEKKQIELNGSQVTMRALKGRIRCLETELSDSQKLVAELEAHRHRAAGLEAINTRLVPDLDSARHLVKLLTTNNEVLLQKIIELGTDATGLEIKTARLTDEIGLLRDALREYEEEKEVEEAVLNLDEQSSVEAPSQRSDSSVVSTSSDFGFAHPEKPSSSLEVPPSAVSEGAQNSKLSDDDTIVLGDQDETQSSDANSEVVDYVLVQNTLADAQPSSTTTRRCVFGTNEISRKISP
ncbi:uncharacterized protein EV420DRAFT_1635948 [Desarmillaria tabescens]|uniref:Uncharacterized protein n=1 Tax=Armillaria tabescens TaxID=1929756 RepID=A0AA39NK11_ARMTA|nr:uncharacterized protein EV420DRAFT_1635948 [Desarmillaria tabescens]KAK0466913.1 hypothetical protein EV420DRAFT_1635948 [Desarmillaria tabescens]